MLTFHQHRVKQLVSAMQRDQFEFDNQLRSISYRTF